MLRFRHLFSPHHIAALVDWLEEKGHVCLELYHPHSGSSPSYFTIHSLEELKQILDDIRWPEAQITIWKNHEKQEFESDEFGSTAGQWGDLRWIYSHNDEVMYFSVQKNRNWCESYQANPNKYRKRVDEWSS